jgi:hypothetical protein
MLFGLTRRWNSAPVKLDGPQTPAPPAPPMSILVTQTPTRRSSSSNLALYLVLGGLFLMGLCMVVFFAVKT